MGPVRKGWLLAGNSGADNQNGRLEVFAVDASSQSQALVRMPNRDLTLNEA